jgi:hypothetical protein
MEQAHVQLGFERADVFAGHRSGQAKPSAGGNETALVNGGNEHCNACKAVHFYSITRRSGDDIKTGIIAFGALIYHGLVSLTEHRSSRRYQGEPR